MATVAHTRVETPYDSYVKVFKWVLTGGDVGDIVSVPHLKGDKTFMVFGTFAAGSVSLNGTLAPGEATLLTLKDPQGNALTFTADDIEAVAPAAYDYQPAATAGVTSVTVYLFVR